MAVPAQTEPLTGRSTREVPSTGYWAASRWRMAAISAAYALAWIALAAVSHRFWFLPAGLRLGALWVLPSRRWGWLLLGEWTGQALIALHEGWAFDQRFIGTGLVPWLVYAALVRLVRGPEPQSRIGDPKRMLLLLGQPASGPPRGTGPAGIGGGTGRRVGPLDPRAEHAHQPGIPRRARRTDAAAAGIGTRAGARDAGQPAPGAAQPAPAGARHPRPARGARFVDISPAQPQRIEVSMCIDMQAEPVVGFPIAPHPLPAITDRVLAQQGAYRVEPLHRGSGTRSASRTMRRWVDAVRGWRGTPHSAHRTRHSALGMRYAARGTRHGARQSQPVRLLRAS